MNPFLSSSSQLLMVAPDYWQPFLNSLPAPTPELMARGGISSIPDSQKVQTYRNVALLPMRGMFGVDLGFYKRWGARDLLDVKAQLMELLNDNAVDTIVLDFSSGGGVAQGEVEVLDVMRQLREAGKRLVAYSETYVASMAYWLACGCDYLVGTPTSLWGSVSSYMFINDYSESYAQQGVEVKGYVTGKFKAIGYPGREITAEQEAHLAETWAPQDASFKDFVAERRGLAREEMEGQLYRAQDSPEGMVDALVMSFEELMAELVN